jgi:tRNA threonylcarbamoyladenosine biosynthesis protein TsaB
MRDGALRASESRAMRHGHVEALFPMIDRVMAEAGLAPAQLDAVAVATGPGGFTGIRVGLAAAHGIALAVGVRLIGVTSFAAVAARIADTGAETAGEALLVALDSRRADLYVQLFARDGASPLAAPQALLAGQLKDHVARLDLRSLLIAGDAAAAAATALGGRLRCAVAQESAPDAQGVAAAALAEIYSDAMVGPVRPLYLRPPDVTLPKRQVAASPR